MTMIVSTVGFNFHVLVPVLASKTLHVGAEVFGALGASFGLGALAGALLAATFARASWKALVLGSAGFSTTLLALAPVSSVWPVAVLLFLTGVFFTTWTANSQSIIQLTAPDHLRGRVLSIYLFAFGGFAPVGGLLAGWLVGRGRDGARLPRRRPRVHGDDGVHVRRVAAARRRGVGGRPARAAAGGLSYSIVQVSPERSREASSPVPDFSVAASI